MRQLRPTSSSSHFCILRPCDTTHFHNLLMRLWQLCGHSSSSSEWHSRMRCSSAGGPPPVAALWEAWTASNTGADLPVVTRRHPGKIPGASKPTCV